MLNAVLVNNIPKINNYNPLKIRKSQNLSSDTFIKSTNNISFKGTSSSFCDWAKKTDFIRSVLPEIYANDDNKIGSGYTHSAYNIPGCDDYIMRISNSSAKNVLDFETAVLTETENKNLGINIGQKTAEIELKDSNGIPVKIEILKKQTGEPIGIPPSQAVFIEDSDKLREGELPYESKQRKEYYASSIHEVAQMPLSAYENLIDNIQIAAEEGYVLDHLNSNNLLSDSGKNSINLIDMNKSNTGADYGNVLYALTNIVYFPVFQSQYDNNPMPDDKIEQALKDTIQITEKFLRAMKNKNVKFPDENKCSLEFFRFINSLPFSFFCRTGDYNEKWQKLEENGLVGT